MIQKENLQHDDNDVKYNNNNNNKKIMEKSK